MLLILLENNIPVSILTKGGARILEDIDVIKQFGDKIQIGASLTFTSETDSLKWEKGAAVPSERMEVLRMIHQQGIKTWASMEPVIYPDQSLEIMELTKDYVDGYKIGKLNHFQNHEKKFDWAKFLTDSVEIMRRNNELFYIKKDLLEYKEDSLHLFEHEIDMDFMAIKA